MKKFKTLLLIFVAAITLSSCGYNSMVELEENAITQWANVESSYQRRSDLIPNLVNTVKGYAEHEKETLKAVMEARAKATSINIDASKLTAESIQKFQAAQSGISGALGKLMMVSERYPDLKANQNFLELQAQLEGTENRINVERNKYNEAVGNFNKTIKKFPNNMFNAMYGFEAKVRFEAQEGTENAPTVEF
ncbi:MAG: LemA family protein [Flavobacteriales bacterium]|nr:MAG: LemA family protein [Flavobacteriales bacterium]